VTTVELRADCARCAALCCVALAFDKSHLFGFDKGAGVPCSHLSASGACTIHAAREESGFQGCITYDCLGAGQRATELFGGRSWIDDPELLGPMIDAFSALQGVHRLLLLLRQAEKLPLAVDDERRRSVLETEVEVAQLERLSHLELKVRRFLRGLRYCAAPKAE
jgi:hypothetical protein